MQELKFEQVEVVSGGLSSGPFVIEDYFKFNAQDGGGNGGLISPEAGLPAIVAWLVSSIAFAYTWDSIGGKDGIDNAITSWLDSYELPSQEDMNRAVRDGFLQGGPF